MGLCLRSISKSRWKIVALHKFHDVMTKIVAGLMGILVGFCLDPLSGIIAAISIVFGGYFLSPDLDIASEPYKRWDFIRWIWIPYQKLFSHRSFWTHFPIFGSAIRILWIAPLWIPLLVILGVNWTYLIIVASGIELAALVHYMGDF